MKTTYIALGTNLGDRLANLRSAIESFAPELRVTRESTIYETPPWGFTDQPAFLNMVIEAETNLDPRALLVYLKKKEDELGRVKNFRNGPRLIDLDILFYDDLIMNEENLIIPHPRLHQRAFVLMPLADIAPELEHPLIEKTIIELLQDVDTSEITPFSV
ncbi:MAG: 2-amino-4-hydroxy-6-hydroxymethyldihydropteridine diphosphokinase [Anaerolineae bacterium]|jgi:2-amino-4-hydroxy-6-hydroxymethyldihydropteridine diphosphokinase|nr:2-amino-4-hydroxy-6-hydroxymethyldihydropteridine diphosphokinase [Anaerolineae bacterium]MBT4310185.1 2-amino-4-hydroxy-6-hydroxymethyldihydropteridine diphosphokinase [Anaerolineae bacterium]MBT4457636.1 2-amino-4-hydroxy-6-hydroxymethyldihydropteridine diphosphokinase [Anaerolineae bacterium]MBT4841131.1 2-amino-4-hydroxy-6-hydroxymethyldihydropteridine diphosphokinase [Anaerolineae bacterium]MBT6062322.1 2-amino-4-hydroxy-6-hydroxymethyldihydropteridine diphosphokinase [Anaerolineae bact